MAELFGIENNKSTQTDLLVESYRRTQQPKVNALKSRQNGLEARRRFYNSLSLKLDSLITQIDIFSADNAASKFVTRSVSSSDDTVLTATASSEAAVGINTVKINRLASNDLLVSKQLDLTDNFNLSAGDYTFDLTVGGTATSISVEIADGDTNEDALNKIVAAVNTESDLGLAAALVKDTSTTGRLTFTANETGSDNRVSFTDSAVFDKLGFIASEVKPGESNRTVMGDKEAGYKVAKSSEINSSFEVNGIKVTRGSNVVSDVLAGVELTLVKPQDSNEQAVTIATKVGENDVENLIQPLLDSFNELNTFLRSDKTQLRGDPAINSLYYNLRGVVSQAVTSVNSGDPQYLTGIGIKISSSGTLSIDDTDALKALLESDPAKVSKLFASADSFVAKINNIITPLRGEDGLIKSRSLSLSSQIDNTVKRTDDVKSQIDRRAEALRKQYVSMLKLFFEAQGQYSLFTSLPGSSRTSRQ